MDMCTLPSVEWIAGGKQPHGTEISSVLCGRLEGWDGEGGREGDAGGRTCGSVCVCIADSLCCKAEANTPL